LLAFSSCCGRTGLGSFISKIKTNDTEIFIQDHRGRPFRWLLKNNSVTEFARQDVSLSVDQFWRVKFVETTSHTLSQNYGVDGKTFEELFLSVIDGKYVYENNCDRI
jgi:uncharacterized protein (DUF2249 family)